MLFAGISFPVAQCIHMTIKRNLNIRHLVLTTTFLGALILSHSLLTAALFPELFKNRLNSPDIQVSSLQLKFQNISPRNISDFRRRFQEGAVWPLAQRPVTTLIYPETQFKNWIDLALFLPKGFFYSAFMPLPGLYPIDQKIGRLAASLENVILLIVAAFGLWGVATYRKENSHWMLLIYFTLLALAGAVIEPDLGSAARHKLQFLPCLFLFAGPGVKNLLSRSA